MVAPARPKWPGHPAGARFVLEVEDTGKPLSRRSVSGKERRPAAFPTPHLREAASLDRCTALMADDEPLLRANGLRTLEVCRCSASRPARKRLVLARSFGKRIKAPVAAHVWNRARPGLAPGRLRPFATALARSHAPIR